MVFGLQRLILIDSFSPSRIVVFPVEGGAVLTGRNGRGKTSLLRLIPVSYGESPNRLVGTEATDGSNALNLVIFHQSSVAMARGSAASPSLAFVPPVPPPRPEGAPRAHGCHHHYDLHPCPQSTGKVCAARPTPCEAPVPMRLTRIRLTRRAKTTSFRHMPAN